MSKVESSLHFNEIVKLLSSGKGGTFVSEYLEREYGEKISPPTLNTYKRENIQDKQKITQELDNIIEESSQEQILKEETAEEDKQLTWKATGKQLFGLLNVSEGYEESVKKMEEEADDPTCKTTWKDVAAEKRRAGETFLNFMKSEETNVEVNVDNNLNSFVDESEVLRFIDESEAEESNSE